MGCPGHGPIHLLSASAAEIGFHWDSHALAWVRPGLPLLSHLAGPSTAFSGCYPWMPGVIRLLLIFVSVRGFGVVLFLMFMVLCSSLILLMFEREIRLCFAPFLVGGVWNGFLLGYVRGQLVPCRFCGAPDHDGHLFWECSFPPLVAIRENPEFHDLMRMDKTCWPRCLLWHGWLPMLSGTNGASPWAVDASESAAYLVEVALGRYSSGMICDWDLPREF